MSKFKFVQSTSLKPKFTSTKDLGFGSIFTDHMAQVDYSVEKGWHDPKIIPYESLSVDPANMSFHYGQLIFEGLKAYKTSNGKICLFRPEQNIKRFNKSAKRICMPEIDQDLAIDIIKELVVIEQDWIPTDEGCSLYIRPFMIATENFIGVRPSKTYSFFVILSPVGSYYKEGINPVDIFVETEYVRAVPGGTGEAKCAGNYASSFSSQLKAEKHGYTQVLWLDGIERKYIEEIGTSNAFFVINNKVVTPMLNGSILSGITRDSTIKVLKHIGIDVDERKITIDEIVEAYKNGTLTEAFASGTAAVISSIGKLEYNRFIMDIAKGEVGKITRQAYDNLIGIQTTKIDDPFSWVVELNE